MRYYKYANYYGAIGFELVKIYLKNDFKVVASSRDIENSKDLMFMNL
ncbi:hypothetical protein Q6A83_06650 [Aliarcobacter skirrowii]|nr:hypothetical protein [Aliarcobacter skirrowii]MDX4050450.1 hypothetical protein [Aliarcobacter skirrowii]